MTKIISILFAIILVMMASAASAHADTVPLYHFENPSKNDHVYKTTNTPATGYEARPLAGYIETTGPPELALYKYKRSTPKPYTKYGMADDAAALAAEGYAQITAPVGYLLPAGAPNTLPTYELQSPAGDVILTGDFTEKDAKLAAGWVLIDTLDGLTQRRCLPYEKFYTNPEGAVDGSLVRDFEEPDPFTNKWVSMEAVNPCSATQGVQVVTAPRAPDGGSYAARYPLDGPDPVGTLKGDRALTKLSGGQVFGGVSGDGADLASGREIWMGESLLLDDEYWLPPVYPTSNASTLLTEFHSGGYPISPLGVQYMPCSMPIRLIAIRRKAEPAPQQAHLTVSVNGGVPTGGKGVTTTGGCTFYSHSTNADLADIETIRNKWQQIVWHVKFCDDDADQCATNGLVEMWLNGVKVFEDHGPNYYAESGCCAFFIGNYRVPSEETPSVVYHDRLKLGHSYAEVAP